MDILASKMFRIHSVCGFWISTEKYHLCVLLKYAYLTTSIVLVFPVFPIYSSFLIQKICSLRI